MPCPDLRVPYPKIIDGDPAAAEKQQENWRTTERWADTRGCGGGAAGYYASFTENYELGEGSFSFLESFAVPDGRYAVTVTCSIYADGASGMAAEMQTTAGDTALLSSYISHPGGFDSTKVVMTTCGIGEGSLIEVAVYGSSSNVGTYYLSIIAIEVS